jgi:sigma54-dependent transcription regulator
MPAGRPVGVQEVGGRKVPRHLHGPVLALRAKGNSAATIADWLRQQHHIEVNARFVENLLAKLRGVHAAMTLIGDVQPLTISDEEVIQRLMGFEFGLFERAQTVPEKRAASVALLKLIELKRRYPVNGDGTSREMNSEVATTLKEVLAQLKGMTPMTVIESPSDSTRADEIDKVD